MIAETCCLKTRRLRMTNNDFQVCKMGEGFRISCQELNIIPLPHFPPPPAAADLVLRQKYQHDLYLFGEQDGRADDQRKLIGQGYGAG